MNYSGEERDILIQKNVDLVQSGKFRNDICKMKVENISGIDSIICFNYMGSSEFEWGALPKSLRRISINKDFYDVFIIDEYKDKKGNSLKVYAPRIFIESIKKIVNRLAINGSGLQEYCTLCDNIKKESSVEMDSKFKCNDNSDFWWDIENDFFIFFENADKVSIAMNELSKRKFGYEKNLPKKSFNSFYLNFLQMANTNQYFNWNTSIKDYQFDEATQTHFIEFLKGAKFENILMEAMIVAKVDKGEVRFSINNILFTINEDTLLDSVINETGVMLTDSCVCSNKISEMISFYNTEALKKQNQKQLVNIFNQVINKKK